VTLGGNRVGKYRLPDVESLEERVLLTSNPFYSASSATDMTLRIEDVNDIPTLRLVDDTDTELASEAVSTINAAINISGSTSGDTFMIDIDAATIASDLPLGISFSALGGSDTVVGADETANIWNVTSSGIGNLLNTGIFAFNGVETLVGGSGEDTLVGPSTDTLWRISDDSDGSLVSGGTLISFEELEVLTGGTGINTLDYSTFGGGDVVVDLISGSAEGNFAVSNFDVVVGTGQGDELSGDEGNNTLVGGAGNDTLTGGTGNDIYPFQSGWGTDTVDEEGGNDSGQGEDTLDFSAVNANLTFTVNADDSLTVTDGSNTVTAESIEHLIGGMLQNTLDLSALSDGVVVDLASGTSSKFLSLTGFGIVIGTPADDVIVGDNNANTLTGGDGDDTISGGGGADVVSAGDGVDTFVDSRDANLTLTNTALQVGGSGEDTLSGFELAQLSGGASANTIDASGFTGFHNGTPLSFLFKGDS
jgi:Ca2+-binding RTX toxin-like protein